MKSKHSIRVPGQPRIILILILTVVCACSEKVRPPFTGSTRDLLSRHPDRVLQQAGRLIPDMKRQWKDYGLSGWKTTTTSRGTWHFVWSNQKIASLDLHACTATARTLSLRMLLPTVPPWEKKKQTAVIRLNGETVANLDLRSTPETYVIETPEEVWRSGENILEIEVDRLHEIRPKDHAGIGLVEVVYDDPLLIEINPAERLLEMNHQTRITHSIEQSVETELVVSGRTTGAGSLVFDFRFFDPATGLLSNEAPDAVRIQSNGAGIEGRILLPRRSGKVLRMDMTWISRDHRGAMISFDELMLLEKDIVERPPIVFISIDTLAARHLSLYGYSRKTSPNLDRFAETAVTFERCKSNASWTLPSYVSMMTGLYPSAHPPQLEDKNRPRPPGQGEPGAFMGRTENIDQWGVWSIPAHQWTLAEMLHAAGYRTAGFTDHFFVSERYRFDQGFEHMDSNTNSGIRRIVPKAVQWLESIDVDTPFFLFIHVYDVHAPYRPPEPWSGKFGEDGLYDPNHAASARGMVHAFGSIPDHISKDFIPEGERPNRLGTAPICSAYDEEILNVDAHLGAFFETLDTLGILDRAMIIINADHGESMIDHDYYFGHSVLYEDITWVPMILRLPGAEHGGVRVHQPVQTVDLYSTIRDFLGLKPEDTAFHGRSLLPTLKGGSLGSPPLFSETGIMRQEAVEFKGWKLIESYPAQLSTLATMVTHPRVPLDWIREHAPELEEHGLTLERLERIFPHETEASDHPRVRSLKEALKGPFHELYYLPDDPFESKNLAESRPDMIKVLLAHLRSYRALNKKTRLGISAASEGAAPAKLSESELEILRQLGYLDGR